ncbi:glycolate oxidase subunit GlcE [Castellaniella sp.]|uniref:glycolate oxidase subunit GlcE n=1 Tax=Castellaniella sp. TaxID=1955812 RepID=UPI002AFFA309|nr:glycolate oxidase subunit GlcE [Castellaniella sp.]
MEFVLSELSEQVVTARAAKRPLMIRGGGTRLFYGEPLPPEDTLNWLDISVYHGVVGYEPSELVLTARAGTPLTEIETLLADQGQMLAFEPPRFGGDGTLGGCVAAGLSGPRRMAAGPLADFVLGTQVLGTDGNVLRFGGEVMKNVAGYDLSRLMAGSLGVLGALVEISIKVMPQPHAEATRVLVMDEAAALAHCLSWRAQPLPISATAWLPAADGGAGQLLVRLSGNGSAVRQAQAVIGGEALVDEQAAAVWLGLRDQTHAFFQQRPLWRLSLPPKAPVLGLGPCLHEWGGGRRWLAGQPDAATLRARVQALGGSACLYHRGGVSRDITTFHPLAGGVMQIHRRLKQEFDPATIFNPRRLAPEL